MQELTLGELIENLRSEQHITKKQLCNGICSMTALSRYEVGERFPNHFILVYLLQRLGKNVALSDMLLNSNEYCISAKRDEIEKAVQRGDEIEASKLINEYEGFSLKPESIHKQYILYCKGQMCEKKELFADAEKYYVLALSQTQNKSILGILENEILAPIEIKIIFRIYRLRYVNKEMEDAIQGYRKIAQYIEEHQVVESVKDEIYITIKLILTKEEMKTLNYGIAYKNLCEVMKYIKGNYKIKYYKECMELYKELCEKISFSSETCYEKSICALELLELDTSDEKEIWKWVEVNKWENMIERL